MVDNVHVIASGQGRAKDTTREFLTEVAVDADKARGWMISIIAAPYKAQHVKLYRLVQGPRKN